MAKRTPPLLTKGLYSLKSPFTSTNSILYTCAAIRSFPDLYELGEDVFTKYYEPLGIVVADFNKDKAEQANIITLMSDDANPVYVPDTYILSYPDMGTTIYSHVVLSMSLGAVPDTLDFDFVKDQVSQMCNSTIGIVPEVNLHKAPSSGAVTPEQHQAATAARLSAITNNKTDKVRITELENQLSDQQAKNTLLEQMLIDNGIIS